MSAPTLTRKVTHAVDTSAGVVVFHIGMTVRRPHRPDLWLPVAAAMPRMLAELERNRDQAARGEAPDLGFLGAVLLVGRSGPWVVQYWRDVQHLYAYARNAEREHLPAWRRFNAVARRHPGAVGIWHETFAVGPAGVETFYGEGARTGLADVAGVVDVSPGGRVPVASDAGAGSQG